MRRERGCREFGPRHRGKDASRSCRGVAEGLVKPGGGRQNLTAAGRLCACVFLVLGHLRLVGAVLLPGAARSNRWKSLALAGGELIVATIEKEGFDQPPLSEPK